MRKGESYIHGWFALLLVKLDTELCQYSTVVSKLSHLPLDTSELVELVIPHALKLTVWLGMLLFEDGDHHAGP